MDNIRLLIEVLVKAKNQTETEWLEMYKSWIDSIPSSDEKLSTLKEDEYRRLHDRIFDAIDDLKN
jgi:hypothetical protein